MIHHHSHTTHALRRISTVSPPYHGGGVNNSPKTTLSPLFSCNYATEDQCLIPENRAWSHWNHLKQPKLIVAPMYDGSELPFRMLCRKYGAEGAYTPMLHSRSFAESKKFRAREFSTYEEDRPLFVQFCGNDPDVLLEAAYRVESFCDYVDINLGKI